MGQELNKLNEQNGHQMPVVHTPRVIVKFQDTVQLQ